MAKLGMSQYERHGYSVAWFEDGEEGALIGQESGVASMTLDQRRAAARKNREPAGLSDFEYLSLEIAAREWLFAHPQVEHSVASGGYVFDAESSAKRFLAAMKVEMKAARVAYDTGVEWPDWAKAASAAGWKPPKGWKP